MQPTSELLDRLQDSALSRDIAGTDHLVTAGLQVVHVLGFVLLLSSWVLVGLLFAVGTGLIMVIGAPNHYFSNPAFQVKLVLFAGAVLAQSLTFAYLGRPLANVALIRIE